MTTGAEINKEKAERIALIKTITEQINVRKWAIEKAMELALAAANSGKGCDFDKTATFIYSFITRDKNDLDSVQ